MGIHQSKNFQQQKQMGMMSITSVHGNSQLAMTNWGKMVLTFKPNSYLKQWHKCPIWESEQTENIPLENKTLKHFDCLFSPPPRNSHNCHAWFHVEISTAEWQQTWLPHTLCVCVVLCCVVRACVGVLCALCVCAWVWHVVCCVCVMKLAYIYILMSL